MPYSFREHTADIRMTVNGKTLGELFQDALLGMAKIQKAALVSFKEEKTGEGGKIKKTIKIVSPDITALLIDFLSEILALSQTDKIVFFGVKFLKLEDKELEAEIEGIKTDSFDEDIKAVTYHEADVKQNKKGEWGTIIVFDI